MKNKFHIDHFAFFTLTCYFLVQEDIVAFVTSITVDLVMVNMKDKFYSLSLIISRKLTGENIFIVGNTH